MNYAQMLDLTMKYGRQFGPKALKAWSTLAALVDKNPQLRKLSDQMGRRLAARRPGSRLSGQIEMTKEFATDALTEQTLPERQDLARSWMQKARGFDMQLRAAEAGPAKLAKVRRRELAERVDALLTEILETTMKWAEGPRPETQTEQAVERDSSSAEPTKDAPQVDEKTDGTD